MTSFLLQSATHYLFFLLLLLLLLLLILLLLFLLLFLLLLLPTPSFLGLCKYLIGSPHSSLLPWPFSFLGPSSVLWSFIGSSLLPWSFLFPDSFGTAHLSSFCKYLVGSPSFLLGPRSPYRFHLPLRANYHPLLLLLCTKPLLSPPFRPAENICLSVPFNPLGIC